MQIDRLSLALTLRSPTASLPALRLGQELVARVQRADAGRILLDIAGVQLEAQTELPLRSGQSLSLRVAQLQPTVVLKLIPGITGQQTLADALRELLPQPGSRTPLAASLANLQPQGLRVLPEPVQRALGALLARLPSAETLGQADTLSRALAHSGLHLERRLAAGDTATFKQDLKSGLLQVLKTLRSADRETVDELARLTGAADDALARLKLLQLHAATAAKPDLFYEFPVLFGSTIELLQLRIEQDAPRGDEENPPPAQDGGFQIRLGFGFADGGRVDALLRLRGEAVSVFWWSERPQTAELLRAHLPLLAERLSALGLEVKELAFLDGPPQPLDALPLLRQGGLVHERA
jgi:hypothetical protein